MHRQKCQPLSSDFWLNPTSNCCYMSLSSSVFSWLIHVKENTWHHHQPPSIRLRATSTPTRLECGWWCHCRCLFCGCNSMKTLNTHAISAAKNETAAWLKHHDPSDLHVVFQDDWMLFLQDRLSHRQLTLFNYLSVKRISNHLAKNAPE